MKYMLHFGPDAMHVEMEGHLTFQDSRVFQQLISAIKKNDTRSEVRLNVTRLLSLDSTGLRYLMMAHDLAKKLHTSLVFEGAVGSVLLALTEAGQYNALHIAA